MTSTSSPRVQAAQTFLHAFDTLDIETHISLRTPSCKHHFAPASITTHAPYTNDEFAAHLTSLREVISSFPVRAKEIIDNEATGQVIVWANSVLHWREEFMDQDADKEEWEYKGEYMFVLDFEEGNDGVMRLRRVLEFLDSQGTEKARALLRRARANKARIEESG